MTTAGHDGKALWELEGHRFDGAMLQSNVYRSLLKFVSSRSPDDNARPKLRFTPSDEQVSDCAGEDFPQGAEIACQVVMQILRVVFSALNDNQRQSCELEVVSADFVKAKPNELVAIDELGGEGCSCCPTQHYKFPRYPDGSLKPWTSYGWSSDRPKQFTDCPRDARENSKEVTFCAFPSYFLHEEGCLAYVFPDNLREPRDRCSALQFAWSTAFAPYLEAKQKELIYGGLFFSAGILGDMSSAVRYQKKEPCYACFVTIKSAVFADLREQREQMVKALAALRPQVQLLMTRALAGETLREVEAQRGELERSRLMLNQLAVPLRMMSDALEVVQSETQEIRAILYEPLDAIFAVHARIAQYFEEGRIIDNPDGSSTKIAHQPTDYLSKENLKDGRWNDARWVLTHLLAVVRGKSPQAQDLNGAFAFERTFYSLALRDEKSSFHYMARKVTGLLDLENANTLEGVVRALNNIKSKLFTPFKPDEARTPIWLSVLTAFLPNDLSELVGPAKIAIPAGVNPFTTQAHLLRFIGGVSSAATANSRNRIGELRLLGDGLTLVLRDGEWCSDPDILCGLHTMLTQERAAWNAGGRRDGENWGDHREPFVRLVRRIPRTRSDGKELSWNAEIANGSLVITIEDLTIHYGREFTVKRTTRIPS